MLANVNLDKDLSMLAKFGRVVVVGSRGRVEIDPRQTMARDADIRGMTLMNVTDAELYGIHRALGAALESGILRPVIDSELPLAEAARAHREILEGGSRGKIILTP
jgi:NADPH2:quinone reductase